MKLHIAPDFSLPAEAVTETFAILAKRGSGKTYCAAVLVEEMVKAGLPVAIVDPVGVWHGLHSNAAGDGPGLPVVVFGGDHADLPLDEGMGAAIADLLVEQRFPAVLDLSLLSKSAARRFMTAFAERLYHKNKDALHLVLDEADAWAPQRTSADGARLLGAIEDLVRRGRAKGIGVTLITQRPAVLNKDVLTQAEVLIALRMTGPRDVAAIDEWVRLHADEDEAQTLKSSLPSLPVGTAWVWSPGWLSVLQKIEVRKRETFDSSATPKVGEKRIEPTERAAIDLDALRKHLSAQVEAAEASDPAKLQKRVRQLEGELAQRPTQTKIETKIERVEVPILGFGEAEILEGRAHDLIAMSKDMHQQAKELQAIADEILAEVRRVGEAKTAAPPSSKTLSPRETKTAPAAPKKRATPTGNAPTLSAPKQRVLDALMTLRALEVSDVAKSNVAVWSDQSPKSSAFDKNLRELRNDGLLDYPSAGRVSLTEAGAELADVELNLTSCADLHQAWCARLSSPQARMVRLLVEQYPDPFDRETLADLSDQSPTSSAFDKNIRDLRNLGLVHYPSRGEVAATELLFPEGLK